MAGSGSTNPVYETMTTFRTSKYKIRVWREVPLRIWKMGPDEEIIEALSKVITARGVFETSDFIDALKHLPNISAIEVLNSQTHDGGIYYPDWR